MQERGKLHIHDEHSLRDSAEHISNIVKRGVELGVTAMALTNHGVTIGNYEFVRECEKAGIKPIPSYEGYYSDDEDIVPDCHIGLYPEDYEAYSYMGMAITEAGQRIHNDKPVFSTEMLKKYFGEGSPVHGKVMFTSACVKGVFAGQMFANKEIQKKIVGIELKLKDRMVVFDENEYNELLSKYENIQKDISRLKKLKEESKVLANKKIRKEEKRVDKLKQKGDELYDTEMEKLRLLKAEITNAKREVIKLTDALAEKEASFKEIKKQFEKADKEKNKISDLLLQKSNLEAMKMTEDDMYNMARNKVELMIEIFGKDNIFCEIQYHGLDIERYIYPFVVSLADEYGLKLVCTNDAHFAYPGEDSVMARQMMLSLRFDKYVERTDDMSEYYIKSDEELRQSLRLLYSSDVIERAFAGVDEICNRCNFKYPCEKHYPSYHGDADKDLRKAAYDGIMKRYPDNWDISKQSRLDYELEVIKKLGVSDYLCIVSDFIREAKRHGKEMHPTGLTYSIGPGRGSAAGSMVCYLTEITNIDPLKYDLLFQRFLNPERVTMPDIDTDLSYEIRGYAINYCCQKYGESSVCSIMTEDTQAARQAVRNAAKFLGMRQGNPKKYLSTGDMIAKIIPKEVDITINKCVSDGIFDNVTDENQKEILRLAKLIEGTISGYGLHAAGIIIGDGDNISRHIPLKYYKSKNLWGCQCNMVEAEELGLLKMDFLGLKTLDVETKTIRFVKETKNVEIDLDNLPFEEQVFKGIYCKGNTLAIFQVESPGMKSFMKQLQPKCIEDIIAGIALYRPGPMDFIPQYLSNKQGGRIEYICPQLKPILENTYGCIVYQEQVMEIFRQLAGYSLGEADIIRRYMSKKKVDKLLKEREIFVYGDDSRHINGCIKNGISEDSARKIFSEMEDFAKYAFNKSHAAAYAIVSYQTAYLKYHYPVEFYTAVMSYTSKKKLPFIIAEAKEKGIKILPPDINKSKMDFVTDGESIIFGFNGIDGIGENAAVLIDEQDAKYRNFKDFLFKMRNRNKSNTVNVTVIIALINSGAFDQFCSNRKALRDALPYLWNAAGKIVKKQYEVNEKKDELNRSPNDSRLIRSYDLAVKTLNTMIHSFNSYVINENVYEDILEKLNLEYAALGGIYVSGHPLDSYKKPNIAINIMELDIKETVYKNLYGMVKNLEIKHRKSDNREMAFFELEDTTGKINVVCFANEYLKYSKLIKENAVLSIMGSVSIKEDEYINDDYSTDDNDIVTYQLSVKKCTELKPIYPAIVMHIPNMCYYAEHIQNLIEQYRTSTEDNGRKLIIHDRMTGMYRQYMYPVLTNLTQYVDDNISFSYLKDV